MPSVLQILATLVFAGATGQNLNVADKIGRGLGKELAAVKQPIDETLTFIGSSQCSNVKKLIGVEYEQVKGIREPDLNQLTLNFLSQSFRVTYNITAAAELVPLTRGYNHNQNLIIFIHGFTDDPTTATANTISNAFLSQGEFNILALDGSSLIKWLYLRSTTYVRFMGEKLGATLAAMVKGGMNPRAIHLIGHSLGSHIAGFTGKTFTDLTGRRVGRISGLDPAGPCFSNIDPELRLKATDADFVDVIHTDAGVYGLRDAVGHVDFFPNSGSQQPNCLLQTCSHSRAWLYYAESVVNKEAFLAVPCKDWDAFRKNQCGAEISIMGYGTRPSARGVYFLRTAEDSPYGLSRRGTVYENNEGVIRTIGSKILG
ncbi:pancreatic lipase-related protein 2 [Bombyx mori]|uniref:Lipase domain-containing protein n=1 Tax=Bombyx mori TaxID=7091 RepID=A0A8R1WJH7_BOMMO|nr:pancreatic lipase-related protein 2 [Bombyx mori]